MNHRDIALLVACTIADGGQLSDLMNANIGDSITIRCKVTNIDSSTGYEVDLFAIEEIAPGTPRQNDSNTTNSTDPQTGTVRWSSTGLRVRSGPSTSYPIIRTLEPGTTVTITEQEYADDTYGYHTIILSTGGIRQLHRNCSFLRGWNNDITHSEVQVKRRPGVFDLPYQLEADSGIFSLGGYGLKSPGRKRDKVIATVNRNNLIHHPLDIFDCPRELPEQKVNIHGGATFKICQRINEQAAFENQIFCVTG